MVYFLPSELIFIFYHAVWNYFVYILNEELGC